MIQTQTYAEIHGSFAYENWIAYQSGLPILSAMEYPLFSDAHIIGNDTIYGPYQLLNALNIHAVNPNRPAIILRVDDYRIHDPMPMDKPDGSRYHGGILSDEIAALVSLCLGIRLKAGEANRNFTPNHDPKGTPFPALYGQDPIILQAKRPFILPGLTEERNLEQSSNLKTFNLIAPGSSIALVRAARLYQEAVWIAESTPELSWIMLTSAIETAAGHWRKENASPLDRLRASRPELETLLLTQGDELFVTKVAEIIADYMGATKKFTDFILEFKPDPPEIRPDESYRISWESRALRESMNLIYRHRSKALHSGIPFPAPMCWIPNRPGNNHRPAEKPVGSASSTRGGVWITKDMPMLLHTFEYIVRGSLLKWWSSIPSLSQSAVS